MSPAHPAWVRPLPNALTIGRLALAVALPFTPTSLRLPAIVVGGLTDLLDGWIARRFRATTDLGRILDGVADKAFALSVVVTLTLDGTVRPWQGPLVLARDLTVTALAAAFAATHGRVVLRHMQVRWPGKLATLLAFAWFATLLAPVPQAVRDGTFVLATSASVWAAVDYVVQAERVRRRG